MHSHVMTQMDTEILTANCSLTLFGKTIIGIDINGYVSSNTAVEADITIDGILGIDFQRAQNCVIDITKCSMKIPLYFKC